MNLEDFKTYITISKKEYPTGTMILSGEFCFTGREIIGVDEQLPAGYAERQLVESMWNTLFGDIYKRLERLEKNG